MRSVVSMASRASSFSGGASPKGDLELRRATVRIILGTIDHSLVKTLVNKGLGNLPLIGQYMPKMQMDGRTRPQWDVEKDIFANLRGIPDVRITKLNDRGERELTFNFLSSNEDDLNEAIGLLEGKLRASPILSNVSSEGALPRPELQIHPRKDEIARLGITPQQISQTIRVATTGDVDAALTKISLDNRLIPIRVQTSLDVRRDLQSIGALKVKTASGATVPIDSVADISYSEGPSSILRNARNRVASIGSDVPQGTALDTSTAEFKRIVDETQLPSTVRLAESGDAKIQSEMMQSFGNAMLLGLLMVLVVLILLFKDVIQPFTILLSLPLAIGGVAVALILTRNAFFDAGHDRGADADGYRYQECHSSRRFRRRDEAPWHGAGPGHDRGRPQARPADHHDVDRHVGRHDPLSAWRR